MIRPHKLEPVKSAIAALGVSGLNVTDVRGVGNSPEQSNWFAGEEHLVALPIRAKVEVIVGDEMEDPVVAAILDAARTGHPGDGKIFVEKVVDAVRIRTAERGDSAV